MYNKIIIKRQQVCVVMFVVTISADKSTRDEISYLHYNKSGSKVDRTTSSV